MIFLTTLDRLLPRANWLGGSGLRVYEVSGNRRAAKNSRIVKTMTKESERAPGEVPEVLIVEIAAHQDRAAFVQLFGQFAPRIKSMMMRGGAQADAAEDIAQEAMLSVWRKASYFNPEKASAAAWIFTIARNLRIDLSRRQRRAALHVVLEEIEPPGPIQADEIVSTAEREARVRKALILLPSEQLEVVKLAFIDGVTHAEIAEKLQLPLGTVKSRMRLAMGRLRKLLEELK